MKNFLLSICLTVMSLQGFAQLSSVDDIKKSLAYNSNKDTVGWVHSGLLNIGLNEGFLHNWSAGGELASLSINAVFNGNVTRLYHQHIWSNDLVLAYSLFYAYSNNFVPRKADDRIDFTSRYGVRIDTSKNFYFTTLFNFKSQFTKGFDYSLPNFDSFPTSKFFSPAYLTLAVGLEYRKGTDLSLFFSPIAARYVFSDKYYTTRTPDGAFGIPYGKSSKFEFGAYFSGRYTRQFSKKTSFTTRLDLYSNYLAKNAKDSLGNIVSHDNPGNISVYFDNLFAYKATKYFSITVGATFLYDNNIPYSKTVTDAAGNTTTKDEPGNNLGWLQIKQLLTFGLLYKF